MFYSKGIQAKPELLIGNCLPTFLPLFRRQSPQTLIPIPLRSNGFDDEYFAFGSEPSLTIPIGCGDGLYNSCEISDLAKRMAGDFFTTLT
jgi:hypothetical protein